LVSKKGLDFGMTSSFLRSDCSRFGCRSFWDSDTDNYAQDVFMNVRFIALERNELMFCEQESLFCVAAAFGVYYY